MPDTFENALSLLKVIRAWHLFVFGGMAMSFLSLMGGYGDIRVDPELRILGMAVGSIWTCLGGFFNYQLAKAQNLAKQELQEEMGK